MIKKNSKKVSLGNMSMLLLWVAILGLTLLRLIIANSGSLGESEAMLAVCAAHPAGGYVEGPCGVPLLAALLLLLKPLCASSNLLMLRWVSLIATLFLSWSVWWIARRIAPRNPMVAFWSVLGVNCLPWVNEASLIMDGTMVTASLILLPVVAGWNAVDAVSTKGNQPVKPWLYFGLTLGFGTLFYYPTGCFLPLAALIRFRVHSSKYFPWKGVVLALGLLTLGWIIPLSWNARHDWIQWSSVARGFDTYLIGGYAASLSLCVVLSALTLPVLILLASTSLWLRNGMIILFLGFTFLSFVVVLMPAHLPSTFPSPRGVQGVTELSQEILKLRKERPDTKGINSFLIAQSPGLAALIGEKISVTYPERPGAPPVFVAESPSLNSSYSLWPSYADAVAPTLKDILYTTEPYVSPFLGRNALYITKEAPNELPQTITGAFNAVGLLKEMPLKINGQSEIVRIYQCEGYHALSF